MKNSHKSKPHTFPKALANEKGEIDLPMLKDFFVGKITSPGKKIRDLIDHYKGKSFEKSLETYERLALCFFEPDFLEYWNKKSSIGPLYNIVLCWAALQYPELEFKSEELKSFWRKKTLSKAKPNDAAVFPVLDRIKILVDVVRHVASTSPKAAAMFCWALVENAEWNSQIYPDEKSLINLRDALVNELESQEQHELIELLSPLSPSTATLSEAPKGPPASSPAPPVTQDPLQVGTDADLRQLQAIVVATNSLRRDLEAQIISLERAGDWKSLVVRCRSLIDKIEERFKDIDTKAAAILRKVRDSLREKTALLKLDVEDGLTEVFNLENFEEWSSAVHSTTAKIVQALPALESLFSFGPEFQAFLNQQRLPSLNLEALPNAIDNLKSIGAEIDHDRAAYLSISARCTQNAFDFNWTPFSDTSLSDDQWIGFGRGLIREQKLGGLLGLCVRRNAQELFEKYANLLEDVVRVADNAQGISDALDSLRWLTLGQLERLSQASLRISPLVALAELGVAVAFSSIDKTVAHSFWNAYPLRDVLNNPAGTSLKQLASTLHNAYSSDDTEPRPLSVVQRIFRHALEESKSPRTARLPSWPDMAREQLLDILMFHPHGGYSYSNLWQKVYDDIFLKMFQMANGGQLTAVHDHYLALREGFDFNDHLPGWKTTLPEHQRKKSEYEKSIRLAVSSKFGELDKWADQFAQISKNDEPKGHLPLETAITGCIRTVMRSGDGDSAIVKAWIGLMAAGKLPLPSISPSILGDSSGNFEAFISSLLSPIGIGHPRAFLRQASTQLVTQADYLADEMLTAFCLMPTIELAKAFVEQSEFEAYAALSLAAEEELPLELERRFEDACEKITTQASARLENARMKSGSLRLLKGDDIAGYFADAELALASQSWRSLEPALRNLEQLIDEANAEEKRLDTIANLQRAITQLGGKHDGTSDVAALNKQHEQLLEESAPRRQHTLCLRALKEIAKGDAELIRTLDSTLAYLEHPECLPSADDSNYLKYILEHAVRPLSEELRRCHNYQDKHRDRLLQLANRFASKLSNAACPLSAADPVIVQIVETEPLWKKLEGGTADIENLLARLGGAGETTAGSPEPDEQEPVVTGDAHAERLWLARRFRTATAPASVIPSAERSFAAAVESGNWKGALAAAIDAFSRLTDDHGPQYGDWLTRCVVSQIHADEVSLSDQEYSAALNVIGMNPEHPLVRRLMPSKGSKGLLGDLVARFFERIARSAGAPEESQKSADAVIWLGRNYSKIQSRAPSLRLVFNSGRTGQSITAKAFWESLSGDSKQAEVRGAFMNVLWHAEAPKALACCLTYPPIEIERKFAERLADVAQEALISGRVNLMQSFADLRKTYSAKPFLIFVELASSHLSTSITSQTTLALSGPLIKQPNEKIYHGVIRVVPREIDSPYSIALTLPESGSVRFPNKSLRHIFDGPFIGGECEIPVNFLIDGDRSSRFSLEAACDIVSITGTKEAFPVNLAIDILGSNHFVPLSGDEIEEAFSGFEPHHVRKEHFVHRSTDEKRIEKALFEGKSVRSLWISSPRRSGKSSMLYWILDGYSPSNGRDNAIIYLTMDETFSCSADFNRWVWNRFRTTSANSQLRTFLGTGFSAIGKELPFDADTGTFLSVLGNRLMATSSIARVVFLIDEVDKLASMYFSGGEKRDAANQVLWQIRNHLIAEQRDIGVVFAGSSAAKRIFLTRPDGPFYNSLNLLELTPFSCDTKEKAGNSRAIVSPPRINGRYTINDASLKHLAWLCAGIPYYMKLLAGATYGIARQPVILISDINEGLKALLAKRTGVDALDTVEGDPGSDELRTIGLDDRIQTTLSEAVIYTVAQFAEPLSGRPLWRGRIYAQESPLVSRYHLPRKVIEESLERCIDLGILKGSEEGGSTAISFAIPILGECIRHRKGHFWSTIDHELESIGESFAGVRTND